MKVPKGYLGMFTDEYLAYANLYGNLIYRVPHYFKKCIINEEEQSVIVMYPKGGYMMVQALKGKTLKESGLI